MLVSCFLAYVSYISYAGYIKSLGAWVDTWPMSDPDTSLPSSQNSSVSNISKFYNALKFGSMISK